MHVLPRCQCSFSHSISFPLLAQPDIVLSQDQVIAALIPAVRADWRALWTTVRDRTMTVPQLRATFGRFITHVDSGMRWAEIDRSHCKLDSFIVPTIEFDEENSIIFS